MGPVLTLLWPPLANPTLFLVLCEILKKKKDSCGFLLPDLTWGFTYPITATAPIERVKLIIQTQDANPRIISGEIPRYTGIGNCFSRVASEQGIGAFWRGNLVNIMR